MSFIAKSVDIPKIAEHDSELSVSSYVQAKDNQEKVDNPQLNAENYKTEEKINALRGDFAIIVNEIES